MSDEKKENAVEAALLDAIKGGMKERMMEMIGNVRLFKEGDFVRFNEGRFEAAPDFSSFSQEYVSFVRKSIKEESVYTVVFDPEYAKMDPVLLVCFEEDSRPIETRWLNYVGYLDLVEVENEDN